VTYFAVTRVPGPAWDRARGMRDQERWEEHAAFMDGLADERFIVLGGPVGEGEKKFLMVVEASGEEEVVERFAADPWVPMGLLRIERVERWEILLRKSSQGAR
jgi:uncharacterized protein